MSDPNPYAELMKMKAALDALGKPISRVFVHRDLYDRLLATLPKQPPHPVFGNTIVVSFTANGFPMIPYDDAADALTQLGKCRRDERVGVLMSDGSYFERNPFAALAEISRATTKPPVTPPAA